MSPKVLQSPDELAEVTTPSTPVENGDKPNDGGVKIRRYLNLILAIITYIYIKPLIEIP